MTSTRGRASLRLRTWCWWRRKGFNLKANLKSTVLSDRDAFTGKHTQDTAFCLLRGFAPQRPERISIQDVVGILESARLEHSLAGSR